MRKKRYKNPTWALEFFKKKLVTIKYNCYDPHYYYTHDYNSLKDVLYKYLTNESKMSF